MTHDHAALYNAYASRDARFDGVFFIGVTSTGIYCRPVCTARTPKAVNCRFFASAEAAEKALFRPCLRCRPELAPGNAPVDDAQRIANLVVYRIEQGAPDDEISLEDIASQFALSARHLRRIVQRELGVSPIELLQTRRLLLAKQLLTETPLSIIEIAFASGWKSVRRFNAAFSERYGMPPTRLRKAAHSGAAAAPETLSLQLAYRPPFDWHGLMAFLCAHALPSVEHIENNVYVRTAQLGKYKGWLAVRHAPKQRALLVEFSHALTPRLPTLLGRLRHLFDLDARPDLIAAQLGRDPLLAQAVAQYPGLRVPGAFDGFELAVRAVLEQQATPDHAATLAGRFTATFGEPVASPYPFLTRLAPTPQRVASLTMEELGVLGISDAHAQSILALARETSSGRLALEAGAPPEATIQQLVNVAGTNLQTAQYIAMRALRWPDVFPSDDAELQRQLGGVTAAQAEACSAMWRPWRSYATCYLWQG